MKKNIKICYNVIGVAAFFVLILIDQITKKAAVLHLKDQQPIDLIRNVFQLYYLENRGAAFGIMQGRKPFFIAITIVILIVIVYIYARMPAHKKFVLLRVLLVLIAAGAVGNFIDRFLQGYVVDFFYFSAINFPVFNVADIYVTCSAVILILTVLFYYKDQDLKELGNSLKPGVKSHDRSK